MRSRNLASLAFFVALAPFTSACDGWNAVETGEYGILEFVPDECGRGSCDLDDPLAVGGSTLITLEDADDDGDVNDIELVPSVPGVLAVELVRDGAFSSDWRITGLSPGWIDLVAVDYWGHEVDHIDVSVELADALHFVLEEGSAARSAVGEPGFGEVWRVPAGQRVAFNVRPSSGGWEMMGRLTYTVVIDEVIYGALEDPAAVDLGQLAFSVPAGRYPVTFTAPDGPTLNALIIAE